MKTCTELQTMAEAYREIVLGERPWTALGNFLNHWYGYHPDQREQLITDPIHKPATSTTEQERWAAYCAATVEYLSHQYDVLCPEWVHEAAYILAEPWFDAFNPNKAETRERLTRETPETFKKHNVYSGNRMFLNKYGRPPLRKSA